MEVVPVEGCGLFEVFHLPVADLDARARQPVLRAPFSKVDAVTVLTARLLPVPRQPVTRLLLRHPAVSLLSNNLARFVCPQAYGEAADVLAPPVAFPVVSVDT